MYPHLCYTFIDGGYLRALARRWQIDLPNPRKLASGLMESGPLQTLAYDPTKHPNALLGRVLYYDAIQRETPPRIQILRSTGEQ